MNGIILIEVFVDFDCNRLVAVDVMEFDTGPVVGVDVDVENVTVFALVDVFCVVDKVVFIEVFVDVDCIELVVVVGVFDIDTGVVVCTDVEVVVVSLFDHVDIVMSVVDVDCWLDVGEKFDVVVTVNAFFVEVEVDEAVDAVDIAYVVVGILVLGRIVD